MCRICKNALAAKNNEIALAIIAKAIEKGRKADHFTETIDKILGTGLAQRDLEAEEIWENGHRKVE